MSLKFNVGVCHAGGLPLALARGHYQWGKNGRPALWRSGSWWFAVGHAALLVVLMVLLEMVTRAEFKEDVFLKDVTIWLTSGWLGLSMVIQVYTAFWAKSDT